MNDIHLSTHRFKISEKEFIFTSSVPVRKVSVRLEC